MSANNAANPLNTTNQHGQGASHATGHSKVPAGIQEAAPKSVENALPDSVRYPLPSLPSPLHSSIANANNIFRSTQQVHQAQARTQVSTQTRPSTARASRPTRATRRASRLFQRFCRRSCPRVLSVLCLMRCTILRACHLSTRFCC